MPDVLLRCIDHSLQQIQQATRIAFYAAAVEQRRRVKPIDSYRIHKLGDLDRNIGLGRQYRRGLLHRVTARDQVFEVDPRLIHQHDLEDRVDRSVAVQAQCFAQRLEPIELVIERLEVVSAALLQIVDKPLLLGKLRAQHQRVDEETYQRLDIRPLAIGQGGANDNVALTGMACQQQREQRMQADEG